MHIMDIPFGVTDWSKVPVTTHAGESGSVRTRACNFGAIRVRMVEYSAGYKADHWCEKGHILLCLEGELHTELADGTLHVLAAGSSYQVADGASRHRSFTPGGARLFIVD